MLRRIGWGTDISGLDQKTVSELYSMLSVPVRLYRLLSGTLIYFPIFILCAVASYNTWGWTAWTMTWLATCMWIILARGVLGLHKMSKPPSGKGVFRSGPGKVYADIAAGDPVWYLDILLVSMSWTYISLHRRDLLTRLADRKRDRVRKHRVDDERAKDPGRVL